MKEENINRAFDLQTLKSMIKQNYEHDNFALYSRTREYKRMNEICVQATSTCRHEKKIYQGIKELLNEVLSDITSEIKDL